MSDESEDLIAQAELAAWDAAKRQAEETDDAMFRQNIVYHDRICDLEKALRQIKGAAHKRSMTPAERLQDIRIILGRVGSVGERS